MHRCTVCDGSWKGYTSHTQQAPLAKSLGMSTSQPRHRFPPATMHYRLGRNWFRRNQERLVQSDQVNAWRTK